MHLATVMAVLSACSDATPADTQATETSDGSAGDDTEPDTTSTAGDASSTNDTVADESSGGDDPLPVGEWTAIDFPSSADVFTVWAPSSDNVWIGADDGLYHSTDGVTIVAVDLGMPLSIRDIGADLYFESSARAAGSSGALRMVLDYHAPSNTWTPFNWTTEYTLPQTGAPLRRISSAGAEFWITATDGSIAAVFELNAIFDSPNLYDATMGDLVAYAAATYAIVGPFATLAYAGADRGVFRYGGATSGPDNWTRQTDDILISDMHYDADNAGVWAVGSGIHRFDGVASWDMVEPSAWTSIQAVGDELWVVGDGRVGHASDGSTFTILTIAPGAVLNDVGGATPEDLWAVGTAGTILRCLGPACGDPSSAP
jgi:hypothetical protein